MSETVNSQEKQNENFTFQAEVQQLLNILIYSLYTEREIFLRELISNAADALDKVRYLSLTTDDILDKEAELEINIQIDKENNQVKIIDTGVGMTREELIENIGTIAKSGTGEFLKKMQESQGKQNKDQLVNLIGQFGVGFYSVFMVAKQVDIMTKSYQKEAPAYKWSSDGSGSYTIEPVDKTKRGTEIIVYLKEDAKEFADEQMIRSIIDKHSRYVPFPIKLADHRINQQQALWTRSKSDIKTEEYHDFYKYITNSSEDPFSYLHVKVEGRYQYNCLLYIPKTNYEIAGLMKQEHGVGLYVNRVLIDPHNKILLPEYLRFIRGVVDSEDLPLNVSRESLQDNNIVRAMKSNIVKKILDHLLEIADKDEKKYQEFWNQFGKILREGMGADFENKEKLAKLLRFNSSHLEKEEELTSLSDYVSRMKPDQNDIYFAIGHNRTAIENSPHLEAFKKHSREVLFLFDPIEEFILTGLMEFQGKKIKSVDASDIEFLKEEDKQKIEEQTKKVEKLIQKCKEILGDKVKEVQVSTRLESAPCCLVNPDSMQSSQMQKLMQMMDKNYKMAPKIMEINPSHPLITKLNDLVINPKGKEEIINLLCNQLYDNAMLMEGIIPDINEFVPRTQKIMEMLATD